MLLKMLGIYLSIFLFHCLYIFYWGVNVPYQDQWDSEVYLYRAFLNNQIDLSFLITPHNEHRIAVTRLWSLLLFIIRGGWDLKFGMYAQALIQSANAVIFFMLLNSRTTNFFSQIISAFTIIFVFGLPYSEENILWSFNNQHYWMEFFLFLSLYFYLRHDSYLKFLSIALLNFLSIFTVAAGILTICISICLSFYFGFIQINRRIRLQWICLLLFQIFLLILGMFLSVTVANHTHLKAYDIYEFVKALMKILNWPSGLINLILCIPLIYLLTHFLLEEIRINFSFRFTFTKRQLVIIALTGWIMLVVLITSYARANADVLASRYLNNYALLFPILLFLIMYGFNRIFSTYKNEIGLVCLALILFSIGNYSITKSLPAIKERHDNLVKEKASLKEAYEKKDVNILIKSNRKLHPLSWLIWEGVTDPTLNPHYLWLKE